VGVGESLVAYVNACVSKGAGVGVIVFVWVWVYAAPCSATFA